MNKANYSSFLSGMLFSLGLGFSGMMNTEKVEGFLDIFGKWDPSLMMVMGGAVMMTFIFYPLIFRREKPLFTKDFSVPKNKKIDWKLIIGAILFGAGWGISGLCPGPAIANLATMNPQIFIFVFSLTSGFYLYQLYEKKSSPKLKPEQKNISEKCPVD